MKTVYKPFIIGFFCAILTIIQAYISMGEYAKELSSGCIDCSFNEVLIKHAIVLIFFPIVIIQLVFSIFKKKQYFISIIIIVFLIFVWLKIINTDIFETRVSNWSSFSNEDIDSFVLKRSFQPISICIIIYIIFILILNKYIKKSSNSLE
jgi:hypothetical protein